MRVDSTADGGRWNVTRGGPDGSVPRRAIGREAVVFHPVWFVHAVAGDGRIRTPRVGFDARRLVGVHNDGKGVGRTARNLHAHIVQLDGMRVQRLRASRNDRELRGARRACCFGVFSPRPAWRVTPWWRGRPRPALR